MSKRKQKEKNKEEESANYMNNKYFLPLLFLFVLSFYIIFQMFLYQTNTGYDHSRDLIVVKEIVNRGTLSYFGENYIINPPLYYIIHAIPVWMFGFNYAHQKLLEILFYFASGIIFYFICRELFESKKHIILSYLIYSFSWVFIYATNIRSYSFLLFFGNLTILLFLKFYKNQTFKNILLLSLIFGIDMLIKSSLLFLIMALMGFYFISNINFGNGFTLKKRMLKRFFLICFISFIVYLPFILYTEINNLPLSLQASSSANSPNAHWRDSVPEIHFFSLFVQFYKMFPLLSVLSLVSLLVFFKQIKKEPSKYKESKSIFYFLFLFIFLIAIFILPGVEIRHCFYLFPIAVILVVSLVKKYNNFKLIGLFFIVYFLATYLIFIPSKVIPMNEFKNSSFFNFTNTLTKDDMILMAHEQAYTKFPVFSNAISEYLPDFNPTMALIYNADYYVSKNIINDTNLNYKTNYNNPSNHKDTFIIYKINITNIIAKANLTPNKTIKILNSNGKPISRAKCNIYSDTWKIPQISNNNGTILNIYPINYKGKKFIQCIALGYDNYDGELNTIINMGKLHSFYHPNYIGTRY